MKGAAYRIRDAVAGLPCPALVRADGVAGLAAFGE
jgi:hypothetical protein